MPSPSISAELAKAAQRAHLLFTKANLGSLEKELEINAKLKAGDCPNADQLHYMSTVFKKGNNFTKPEDFFRYSLLGGSAGRDWVAKAAVSLKVELKKVNEELGLIFGYAIVSSYNGEPYFDTQGDWIPEDSMLKISTKFMQTDRIHKVMHDTADGGEIVFGFPLTKEIADSFGITSPVYGFMVGVKPKDPEVVAKFKSGEYTGFSIGGLYLDREEVTA